MYSQIRLEAKVPKYRKIRIFRRKNYENARTIYLPRQYLELGVKKSVFMGIVAVLVITVSVDLQLKIG